MSKKVTTLLVTLFGLGAIMLLTSTGFGLINYFVGSTPAQCRMVGRLGLTTPEYLGKKGWYRVPTGKSGYLVELTTHRKPAINNETFLIEDQSSWLTSLHFQEKMKNLPVNKTFDCTYLRHGGMVTGMGQPCLHNRVYCALLGTGTLDDWFRAVTLLMAPVGLILCFSVLVGGLVAYLMRLSKINSDKAAARREETLLQQGDHRIGIEMEQPRNNGRRQQRRGRRRRDGYAELITRV